MVCTCDTCGIKIEYRTTNTNMCAVSVARCFSEFGNDVILTMCPTMCAKRVNVSSGVPQVCEGGRASERAREKIQGACAEGDAEGVSRCVGRAQVVWVGG